MISHQCGIGRKGVTWPQLTAAGRGHRRQPGRVRPAVRDAGRVHERLPLGAPGDRPDQARRLGGALHRPWLPRLPRRQLGGQRRAGGVVRDRGLQPPGAPDAHSGGRSRGQAIASRPGPSQSDLASLLALRTSEDDTSSCREFGAMSQTEPEADDQVLQWVMLLQGHEDEYGGQLSLTDFDTFQAQLADIASVLRDDPARAAECRTNLIALVSRYPSVGQWLFGVDPAYRDLPGVNEPLAVEPEADAAEPEVTPAEPAVAEPVVTTRSVPAVEVAALAVAAPDPGPGDPAREQAAPPAAPSRQSRQEQQQATKTPSPESTPARPRFWTPEVVMQAGKEVVTALIGLEAREIGRAHV